MTRRAVLPRGGDPRYAPQPPDRRGTPPRTPPPRGDGPAPRRYARRPVAVIGAGVIGCLVAWELAARDPEALITVFDRDAVGAGATRRSAGLHLPRGATPRIRRMSACSHGYYADLRARRPGLPIYPVGATVVSGPGGLDGQYLDQAAPLPASGMRGRAAQPGAAAVAGARLWHIAGCHYCDVYRLAQALAAELRPRVTFAEGVAVTGLEPVGGGVTVHTSSGDRVAAGAVVLAPGPWLSAPGWRHLVAPLGLRVKKIVALHIERRPGPADEVVVFDSDDAFLLPARHRGHWLFSYCCREWDVDPDRAPAGLSARDVRAARECLLRWSPALAGACAGGRVFCDAYSPDGEPVVCALEDTGRIVFAGAASGSGYRLAPAIASQAVDLLLGEPSTMGARTTEGVTGDHQYV